MTWHVRARSACATFRVVVLKLHEMIRRSMNRVLYTWARLSWGETNVDMYTINVAVEGGCSHRDRSPGFVGGSFRNAGGCTLYKWLAIPAKSQAKRG